MPKKLISAMLMLALLCSSLAIPQDFHLTASAETSYTYIDRTWNDSTKTMTKTNPSISSYTTVATSDTTWTNNAYGGWYVVTGNTTIDGTVTVTGKVNLLLCDNAKLSSSSDDKYLAFDVGEKATLTIYAQSEGNSMGKLVVKGKNGTAGFSGSGTVIISGGNVSATGSGRGRNAFSNTVTINGGNVSATGGSAVINTAKGDGGSGFGGTVTINGGTITATGGNGGDVSGDGGSGFGGTVTINGGNVSATGGQGGSGDGKAFSQTPKNSNETELSLKTYTLNGVTSQTKVHSVEGVSNYGLNDVHTLTDNDNNQKLYFYLPAGENVTRVETEDQVFKPKDNGTSGTLYPVFSAQTTLGYPLIEGNTEVKITLPTLEVLQTESETKNLIENTDQLAWYLGENELKETKVNNDKQLVRAKYKVNVDDTEFVGDAPDKYQIIEVVDNRTLYVGVFETSYKEKELPTDQTMAPSLGVAIEAKNPNKIFSCWRGNVDNDEALELLSYQNPYYFYPRSDRTIIAEYKDSGTVETAACTNIESVTKYKAADEKVGFTVVSMGSAAKDNVIQKAGLLATTDGSLKNNLKYEEIKDKSNPGKNFYYYLKENTNVNAYNVQYRWTKSETEQTWYIRSFVQCKDENKYTYSEPFELKYTDGQ